MDASPVTHLDFSLQLADLNCQLTHSQKFKATKLTFFCSFYSEPLQSLQAALQYFPYAEQGMPVL